MQIQTCFIILYLFQKNFDSRTPKPLDTITTKAFKGTGLWQIQNVLSVSNQDNWFDILKTIIKGEDIKFLLTKTLTRYSTIKDSTKIEIPGNN